MKAKPVTVITGFLGAGKTSFLNQYISFRENWKPVIVENEFGEQGIDPDLIVSSDTDIFELNSGCICCSLSENFYDLLNSLQSRRDEFDELIIETTGIADPSAVVQPFLISPQIEKYYKLERVICIADAHLIESQLEETAEARKQISFADIIVINKCDTVREGYVYPLSETLKNINPYATIFSGQNDTGYPLVKINQLTRADFDEKAVNRPKFQWAGSPKFFKPGSLLVSHKEHHHHDITSLSFTFDQPFDIVSFEQRLFVFLNFQSAHIYRVKGLLWVQGTPHKVVVQSVVNRMAVSEGKLWEPGAPRISRIVFIGRNLRYEPFRKMLEQCLINK